MVQLKPIISQTIKFVHFLKIYYYFFYQHVKFFSCHFIIRFNPQKSLRYIVDSCYNDSVFYNDPTQYNNLFQRLYSI